MKRNNQHCGGTVGNTCPGHSNSLNNKQKIPGKKSTTSKKRKVKIKKSKPVKKSRQVYRFNLWWLPSNYPLKAKAFFPNPVSTGNGATLIQKGGRMKNTGSRRKLQAVFQMMVMKVPEIIHGTVLNLIHNPVSEKVHCRVS